MKNVFVIMKVILLEFVVSILLLLGMAFFMYKVDVATQMAKVFVLAIYVIATFIGGFVIGRVSGNKKFLWGMMAGAIYFLILFIVSLIAKTDNAVSNGILFPLLCCLAGGCMGGMTS